MSREKLDALLAGRPRPSGGMCLACLHRDSSCAHLPFKDMPVMRLDKDGTPVVRCTEFIHQQPDPSPTRRAKPDRTGMIYYRRNDCTATSADSPDCICWSPILNKHTS